MKKLFYCFISFLFLLVVVSTTESGWYYSRTFGGGGTWFGPTAEDRSDVLAINYTVIDVNETAPTTGNITSIKIYVTGAVSNAEFGCFYVTAGSIGDTTVGFSSRGIGGPVNLSAGLNTLNAPGDFTAFSCTAGDYEGVYIPSGGGNLDTDISGGSGVYYKNGDQCPAVGINFTNAGTSANIMSMEFYVE